MFVRHFNWPVRMQKRGLWTQNHKVSKSRLSDVTEQPANMVGAACVVVAVLRVLLLLCCMCCCCCVACVAVAVAMLFCCCC